MPRRSVHCSSRPRTSSTRWGRRSWPRSAANERLVARASPGGAGGCVAGRGSVLSTFTTEAVDSLQGPAWLRAVRTAAFERFRGLDLPTAAEEIWRYSRIDDIDLERWHPAAGDALDVVGADAAQSMLDAIGERAAL